MFSPRAHTDVHENERNLPLGYILLLIDDCWFYCL